MKRKPLMNEELIYRVTEEENALAKELLEKDRKRSDALEARLEELDQAGVKIAEAAAAMASGNAVGAGAAPENADGTKDAAGNAAGADTGAAGADTPEAEKDRIYRELMKLNRIHRWQDRHGYDYISELAVKDRTAEAEKLAGDLMPGYYLWAHCGEENVFRRINMYRLAMNYGWALNKAGKNREAVLYLQLARKELRLMIEEEGKVNDAAGTTLYTLLPYALYRVGQLEAAEPVTEEGLRYYEELRATLTEEEYARQVIHSSRNDLCQFRVTLLMEAGNREESEKVLLENARVQKAVRDAYPEETGDGYRRAMYFLATWYIFYNRFEEALPALKEAAAEIRPGSVLPREGMETYRWLASLLRRKGDAKGAEECSRQAKAYENQMPEDERNAFITFHFGRLLRAILYEFAENTAQTPEGEYLRPAVRISARQWDNIRRSLGKDKEIEYSDLIAFADESPGQDQSEGVLVLEQGIRFIRKKKRTETFSWYDIVETKVDNDGPLGIRERGVDKGAFTWFTLKNPELINRLIQKAKDCISRKSKMGTQREAAPEPDAGILDPDAVFERFHVRREEKA